MFTSIIVPLDGSAFSEHALPLAERLAGGLGATLRLVRVHLPVINVDLADFRMGGVPTFDTALDQQCRAGEVAYLEQVRARVAAEVGVPVGTALLDGPVVDALSAYAARTPEALVVMTTHGHGAMTRFWLGSTADGLVRHSPAPVLLQRPHTPETPPPVCRHILVPLDGSALAEQILLPVLALGQPLEAEYTLLHVLDTVVLVGTTPMVYTAVPDVAAERAREAEAHRYLERIAEELRQRGARVRTSVVTATSAPLAILTEAERDQIDLIALATHGRSGLARLLLGSTADKVLRGAETPVLLFRPQARPAETSVTAAGIELAIG